MFCAFFLRNAQYTCLRPTRNQPRPLYWYLRRFLHYHYLLIFVLILQLIFTEKENEDKWVESLEKQLRENRSNWTLRLCFTLTPSCRRFKKYYDAARRSNTNKKQCSGKQHFRNSFHCLQLRCVLR